MIRERLHLGEKMMRIFFEVFNRISGALIEIAAISVFLIPLFLVYHKYAFRDKKRTFFYFIFSCYLTAMLALVGFPNVLTLQFDVTVNAVPFFGMLSDLKNTCLNVLLFFPFGMFLPMLWERFKNIKSMMCASFCMTVFVEMSQIFTFRATDINDVITNMAGALLGYFAAKAVTKNFTRHMLHAKEKEGCLVFGTIVFLMFFLQPLVSSRLWEWILSVRPGR